MFVMLCLLHLYCNMLPIRHLMHVWSLKHHIHVHYNSLSLSYTIFSHRFHDIWGALHETLMCARALKRKIPIVHILWEPFYVKEFKTTPKL